MKRRGGYTSDRIHAVKFRASPRTFEALKGLSEETGMALAWVVRKLVERGLEIHQARRAS